MKDLEQDWGPGSEPDSEPPIPGMWMTEGKPVWGVQPPGGGPKGGPWVREGKQAGLAPVSRGHIFSPQGSLPWPAPFHGRLPSVAAPLSAQTECWEVNNRLLPGSSPPGPQPIT